MLRRAREGRFSLPAAGVVAAALLMAAAAGAPSDSLSSEPSGEVPVRQSVQHAGYVRVAPVRPAARTARSLPPDTLRESVEAGRSLVLSLPDAIGDAPVDQYAMLRGPMLSGVAGRSLAWPTRPGDAGSHTILLQALRRGSPTDTLVVEVKVE